MSPPEDAAGVLDAPESRAVQRTRHHSGADRIAFAASWDTYQLLAEAIGDQHVLLAFDGEKVELMSPGLSHEVFKVLTECLFRSLAAELRFPRHGAGSTRWNRPDAWRGLEADASFYFSPEKIAAAMRRPGDEADWPVPDLAIERDISPTRVDRQGTYRVLSVPEVWQFNGEMLRIDRLGPDGSHEDAPESGILGIHAHEATELLLLDAADEEDFSRIVTEWARRVLLPRRANGASKPESVFPSDPPRA